MAKIEKPEALDDLDSIVDESYIIMIARGDLGVEMDLAKVPVTQRKIIRTCHDHGKPVVVAIQMLQSMIEAPTPTRAEVSDVANAILDGAHAVMLSGESAIGGYPVESVKMMRRITRETNIYRRTETTEITPPRQPRASRYRTAALAHGVSVVVNDLDAKLIIMWSQLGVAITMLGADHRLEFQPGGIAPDVDSLWFIPPLHATAGVNGCLY